MKHFAVGEALLAVEARIGELLPSEEDAQRRTGLPKGTTVIPRELGDKENTRKKRAHVARAIARHPEAVARVVAKAKRRSEKYPGP